MLTGTAPDGEPTCHLGGPALFWENGSADTEGTRCLHRFQHKVQRLVSCCPSGGEAGGGWRSPHAIALMPREHEDASGTGVLTPGHSPCLSFQICEMGTLLGPVGITGCLGKRLQGFTWPA